MRAEKDRDEELQRLRAHIKRLNNDVDRNMRILHASQQRELTLLQAPDLAALFRVMLTDLRDSFRLDEVSVVLCDPDHDIRHLLIAGGSQPGDFPGLIFVDALSGLAPQYVALRKPWLGRYTRSDHSLVLPSATGITSIAMLPLTHKGTLLGSLNFGSADENRFTALHATDFFTHLGVIASFALENVLNRARLLRSGYTDFLTGWHNRRYLQLRIKEELARAAREHTTLVCLMLDIDHFKRINDTWGHAAGDEVLREIAHRIESQVRASDVAARYGGEEFVVLLPATDSAAAATLAERIRKAICETPIAVTDEAAETMTASIGIASCAEPQPDEDLKTVGDSLLARADVALYRAKSEGRDRVAID
ncbi:MAG: sensor domain-containing diguanylate cyclase [Woeseiaceae bacterium]|nr:sensor domain-containing diguanylate cyclase [Woeseiaceae bacterium]